MKSGRVFPHNLAPVAGLEMLEALFVEAARPRPIRGSIGKVPGPQHAFSAEAFNDRAQIFIVVPSDEAALRAQQFAWWDGEPDVAGAKLPHVMFDCFNHEVRPSERALRKHDGQAAMSFEDVRHHQVRKETDGTDGKSVL